MLQHIISLNLKNNGPRSVALSLPFGYKLKLPPVGAAGTVGQIAKPNITKTASLLVLGRGPFQKFQSSTDKKWLCTKTNNVTSPVEAPNSRSQTHPAPRIQSLSKRLLPSWNSSLRNSEQTVLRFSGCQRPHPSNFSAASSFFIARKQLPHSYGSPLPQKPFIPCTSSILYPPLIAFLRSFMVLDACPRQLQSSTTSPSLFPRFLLFDLTRLPFRAPSSFRGTGGECFT